MGDDPVAGAFIADEECHSALAHCDMRGFAGIRGKLFQVRAAEGGERIPVVILE
jgi:hypothetical protein